MAVFTIYTKDRVNLPPDILGNLDIPIDGNINSYILTKNNFTSDPTPQYHDPEGDDIKAVKLYFSGLKGTVELDGVVLSNGDEVEISDIEDSKLIYNRLEDEDDYVDAIRFKASDVGSNEFSTVMGSISFTVESAQNLPPSIGDNEVTIGYGESLVFTPEMFTTDTTPPYEDPEGDPPYELRITELPEYGFIKLNGVEVEEYEDIPFEEVINGNLVYSPDLNNPLQPEVDFDFEISDTGSKIYTG